MKHSKGSKGLSENMGRVAGPVKGQPARIKECDELTEARNDAGYWHSRAERMRNRSRRYKQPAVRDHFVKIAAGYDELARGASMKTNMAEQSSQASSSQREDAQTPDEHRFRSDERRVRDALEDDEVREALQANRERSP